MNKMNDPAAKKRKIMIRPTTITKLRGKFNN